MRGCRKNREQRGSERNEPECVRASGAAHEKSDGSCKEATKKRETAGRKSESRRGIRRSTDEGLRWLCS